MPTDPSPRRGFFARLLRRDGRHRSTRRFAHLDAHLRRDLGLPPYEAPPQNPFVRGW